MDDAAEAMLAFDETIRATRSRLSNEVERVVEETRVRREAQLVREIERASGALGEALHRLSAGQLVHVTEGARGAPRASRAGRSSMRSGRSASSSSSAAR